MPTATALTIRFCWRPDRSGGDGCGLTVSGLADTFQVVGEFRTENQFWSPTFLCGFDKLEDHGPWRCWPRIPSGIRASAAAAGRDRAVWPDPTRPPAAALPLSRPAARTAGSPPNSDTWHLRPPVPMQKAQRATKRLFHRTLIGAALKPGKCLCFCASNVTGRAQAAIAFAMRARRRDFFATSFEFPNCRCILQREPATSPPTSPPRYANTSPRDV